MNLYLLNSPILTSFGSWNYSPLTTDQVKELLTENDFTSAVGHESSAKFLTLLLDVNVEQNRIQIKMQTGDKAITFKLLERLPEGIILTESEIAKFPFEFGLMEKIG